MDLILPITDSISINKFENNELLFVSQKHSSAGAMFQDLSDDAIEMNLRKDIDELLSQANMANLEKVAAMMKIDLDDE